MTRKAGTGFRPIDQAEAGFPVRFRRGIRRLYDCCKKAPAAVAGSRSQDQNAGETLDFSHFEGPFRPSARAQNLDVSAISPYTSAAPRMDLISNPAVSPGNAG
jgi:hypothetical protein